MPTASASDSRLVIGCAATAATAIGVVLVWGPWLPPPAPLLGFDGTPILAAINDPSAPARARRYQAFVAGLALVSFVLLLLPRRRVAGTPGVESRAIARGAAVLLAAAVLTAMWVWVRATMQPSTLLAFFAGFYGALIHPSPLFHGVAALAGVIALPLLVRIAPLLPLSAWWLLLGAYGLAVTLPGLFQPLVLVHMPPEIVRTIEWHYDSVLGGAATLLAGDRERHIGYGYLLSVVKALIDRLFGPLSFAGDVRLVQGMNVLFALAVLAACHAWDRTRPLIALLTLALVLPWVHNNHQNIFFPNQSGLRFIAFPLAIVVLRYSQRLPIRQAALAGGALAALALLWNLETGVAVTAGVLVHVAARTGTLSPGRLLSPALHFATGVAAVCLVIALVSGVGLGVWPVQFGIPRKLLERTTAHLGYGYPLYVDLMALLVFALAIWAVVDLVAAWRGDAVEARTADRGALAVIALVWAPYYVMQPHPWNVWSYLLLGGLLLGERLVPLGRRPEWVSVPVVLAVTIAVPAVAAGTLQTWQSLARGTALAGVAALDAETIGRRVSGVMLTAPDARAIESRATHLGTVPAGAVVMTGNSYLLPRLSGRVDVFPFRDFAYAGTVKRQFDDLVAALRARSPSLILVDDPATLSVGDLHRAYFERLEAALADRYALERTTAGWRVYKDRRGSGT